MKKIYLCGHTGSENRGCEAIVRGTLEVLHACDVTDVTLVTQNRAQDIKVGLNKAVRLIDFPQKTAVEKVFSRIARLLHNGTWGAKQGYKKILKTADKDILLFNIGGDTYCYGTPYFSYALNELAKERNIPVVFWGCSVEERVIKDEEMLADVNRYTKIAVRETLSESILKQALKDGEKLHKVCDPAFHLPVEEVELPIGFKSGDTLGLNLSPMVFTDVENEEDIMYHNVYKLIDYVLEHTKTHVCLIPHVYNIEKHTQDIRVLSRVYNRYKDNARVSIVDKELSCTQLKYIISKCRYFIGARTHSTIAAYSTAVPCLALSYSIKSRGIARDLFDEEEGYAIPYKDIKEDCVLKDAFVNVLQEKEEQIRDKYQVVLPSYKQTVVDETKRIVQ